MIFEKSAVVSNKALHLPLSSDFLLAPSEESSRVGAQFRGTLASLDIWARPLRRTELEEYSKEECRQVLVYKKMLYFHA